MFGCSVLLPLGKSLIYYARVEMRATKRLGREHPTAGFTFRTSVDLNETEVGEVALNT